MGALMPVQIVFFSKEVSITAFNCVTWDSRGGGPSVGASIVWVQPSSFRYTFNHRAFFVFVRS